MPGDHFEFFYMPICICSAPATFQRLMNSVLNGLEWTKALIYLDDNIVWGALLEEHNQILFEVFQRLRIQLLQLESDECEFLKKGGYFWGYKVTADGVAMHDRKITGVKITQCGLTLNSWRRS